MKHTIKNVDKKQATTLTPINPTVVSNLEKIVRTSAPAIFFGFVFVFLLWFIDPAVIYASNGIDIHNYVTAMHQIEASAHSHPYSGHLFYPPFILELSDSFAKDLLLSPGGFSRFFVTVIIHSCHSQIFGALVITAFSLLFFQIGTAYFKSIGTRYSYTLGCIPTFFILTICAWYQLDYLYFLIPVAGSLIFTIIFQQFKSSGNILRLSVLSIFFWTSWYLFQWGSFLFLIVTIIPEVSSGKTKYAPLLISSIINTALLLALDLFVFPVDASIKWTYFIARSGFPLIMILTLPFTAALSALWSTFRKGPQNKQFVWGTVIDVSVLLTGTITLVLWLLFQHVNRDTRTVSRTCTHVMNSQWNKVLNENTSKLFTGWPEKAGTLQAFMIHCKAHALAGTGQIGEKLFHYPQRVFTDDPLLFLESTNTNGYVNWFVVLDLAMDLGMVNTAEKIAGEIMENVGPLPDILYRRALIQIAKDNIDAASVYLRRLSRMPVYRRKSQRLLSMLNDKSNLLSEPRIASMRANMDTTDYFLYTINYDQILLNLLESNPKNKTAFDYLISYYLLTGQSGRVAELMHGASTVGYSAVPRLWEEAICFYHAASFDQSGGGSPPSGLQQSTVSRFNEIARACMAIGDDNKAAAKLAPQFGDSYFFYSIFRYSPGARNE